MHRIIGGDQDDHRARVYKENYPWVFKFFLRRVDRNEDEAGECSDETFFRYYRNRARHPGDEIKNVRGFLRRIARSVLSDWLKGHLKTGKKTTSYDDEARNPLLRESIKDPRPNPEEDYLQKEPDRKCREKCREFLDRNYSREGRRRERLLIRMRLLEGMSIPEIAEALGEPLGTVESDMNLALMNLRNRVKRDRRPQRDDQPVRDERREGDEKP